MAKKQIKDFMTMTKLKHILLSILILTLFSIYFSSCNKNRNTENLIPNVPVNLSINLELPLYYTLNNPGNFVYEDGAGNKGIIIMHGFDGNFYALERTCPFQPFDDCSRVKLDSNTYSYRCGKNTIAGFEKCCESKFQYDGALVQGPAQFNLKSYRISKSGNYLYITN